MPTASPIHRLLRLIAAYGAIASVMLALQWFEVPGGFIFFLGGPIWLGALLQVFMIHLLIAALRRRIPRWALTLPLAFYACGLVASALSWRDAQAIEAELLQKEEIRQHFPEMSAIASDRFLGFYARDRRAKDFVPLDPPLALYLTGSSGAWLRADVYASCPDLPKREPAAPGHDLERTPSGQCAIYHDAEPPSAYLLIRRNWSETKTIHRGLASAEVQPITLAYLRGQQFDVAATVYAGTINVVPPVPLFGYGCIPNWFAPGAKWECGGGLLRIPWRHGPNRYARYSELLMQLAPTLQRIRAGAAPLPRH